MILLGIEVFVSFAALRIMSLYFKSLHTRGEIFSAAGTLRWLILDNLSWLSIMESFSLMLKSLHLISTPAITA